MKRNETRWNGNKNEIKFQHSHKCSVRRRWQAKLPPAYLGTIEHKIADFYNSKVCATSYMDQQIVYLPTKNANWKCPDDSEAKIFALAVATCEPWAKVVFMPSTNQTKPNPKREFLLMGLVFVGAVSHVIFPGWELGNDISIKMKRISLSNRFWLKCFTFLLDARHQKRIN